MIELQQCCREFQVGGEVVRALQDVDLRIAPGDYLSLMGPSGSGKSTLLNVLGLLDRPSRGRHFMDGREVGTLADTARALLRRERIGFVFQSFHLVPRLSTAQNVGLPLWIAGLPKKERQLRVQDRLAAFGLQARAEHRPDELSGGERQRAAIARATVGSPELLLCDEPTGNLDRKTGREVLGVLEGLHDQGMTLVVVTHDPEIGKRAHRRLSMADGRILEERRGDGA